MCGLLAGFGLTLAGLTVFRHGHHNSARPAGSGPAEIQFGHTGQPSPAALDAEWNAYSDRSTCADWAGGDGVSAVRLSSSQIAWFFSDSYLGPAGPATGFSHISGFVHNLVVMQTIAGDRSRFVTLTGGSACNAAGQLSKHARPVVAAPRRRQRYWEEDGLRVGRYVVKFYNRYLPGTQPFVPVGTAIARFPVSQLASAGAGPAFGGVSRPLVTLLPPYRPQGGTPIVWGSAVLRVRHTVYVYGWQAPDPRLNMRWLYLARVPADRLASFSAWRFYLGNGQWAAGQQNAQPIQSPSAGMSASTGFSVVPMAGRYWLIQQAVQAGSPDIDAFPAPSPWGPFDPAAGILVYRSPDIGLDAAHDYRMMYEARAEPALSTRRTLVISYNVNSAAVTAGCVAMSAFTNTITQPRFIAVPRAAFAAATPWRIRRFRVTAGPSRYPSLVRKNPSQWFNGWAYHGGCPPVPAVRDIATRQVNGSLWLGWPSAGRGLRYRVYLRRPGGLYRLVRRVSSPGVTLSGLVRGTTYQVRVVAVNARQHTGPGAVTTVTVH